MTSLTWRIKYKVHFTLVIEAYVIRARMTSSCSVNDVTVQRESDQLIIGPPIGVQPWPSCWSNPDPAGRTQTGPVVSSCRTNTRTLLRTRTGTVTDTGTRTDTEPGTDTGTGTSTGTGCSMLQVEGLMRRSWRLGAAESDTCAPWACCWSPCGRRAAGPAGCE